MADNQEIYVIKSGDDDNVTIRAVFTEKHLAERFVELFNRQHGSWDERAEIETHLTNPFRKVLEGGRQYFKVVMKRDGELDRPVEALASDLNKVSSHFIHADRSCLEACLWADNGADAVTYTNKHRELLVETGQW